MPAFIIAGWRWFTNNPIAQYIAAFAFAVIGYKTWKWNVERGVIRQQREVQARRNAEAEARIIKTITENSNELVRESERVRARDSVVELPNGTRGLPDIHFRD